MPVMCQALRCFSILALIFFQGCVLLERILSQWLLFRKDIPCYLGKIFLWVAFTDFSVGNEKSRKALGRKADGDSTRDKGWLSLQVWTSTGPLVIWCEGHFKNTLCRFSCQFKLGLAYLDLLINLHLKICSLICSFFPKKFIEQCIVTW